MSVGLGIALGIALLFGPVVIGVIGVGVQQLLWWWEDRRWNRFVGRWADAAERGVDVSVLKDCPDTNRL